MNSDSNLDLYILHNCGKYLRTKYQNFTAIHCCTRDEVRDETVDVRDAGRPLPRPWVCPGIPSFAKTSGGVPHASVTELPDVSLRARRYSAGCMSGCVCDDVSLPDLCCGRQPRQHRYEEGHQPSSSGAVWLPTQTCARYTEDHKSPVSDAACTATMCAADG